MRLDKWRVNPQGDVISSEFMLQLLVDLLSKLQGDYWIKAIPVEKNKN